MENEHSLKKIFQSPMGLTIIVLGVALFLVIYMIFSSKSFRSASIVASPTPIEPKDQSALYPTTDPALITSVLSFTKHNDSVDIVINTGSKVISGAQVAISYDPKAITNITLNPGIFFDQPTILQNSIDTKTGTILYTAVVPQSGQQKSGQGVLATISYTLVPGEVTKLSFLPQTKVTSEGVNSSVLKQTQSVILP